MTCVVVFFFSSTARTFYLALCRSASYFISIEMGCRQQMMPKTCSNYQHRRRHSNVFLKIESRMPAETIFPFNICELRMRAILLLCVPFCFVFLNFLHTFCENKKIIYSLFIRQTREKCGHRILNNKCRFERIEQTKICCC